MQMFVTQLVVLNVLGIVIPAVSETINSSMKRNNAQILAKILHTFEERRGIKGLTNQREAEEEDIELGRRNAAQLASMVRYTTGTNPIKYLKYGCWCGIGGKGKTVDELDKCCQTHDRCYGKLTDDHGCNEWWRYFNTYNWEKGKNRKIICKSDKDICKDWKCLCDKKMAECFHEHYKDYKKKYTGWWWALFNDC